MKKTAIIISILAATSFGQVMKIHTGSNIASYPLSEIDSITFELPPEQPVSDSALLLKYLFSGNTKDSSGNGLNGTATAITYGTDRFGNENACAVFDGSASIIEVDNSSTAFNLQSMTVCAWIKPSEQIATGMHEVLVAKGNYDLEQGWELLTKRFSSSSGGTYSMEFDYKGPAGYVRTKVRESTGTVTTAPSVLAVGEWNHLVGVYNYGTKKSRIYLNGELLFESATADVGTATNSKNVTVGAMLNMTSNLKFFKGSMDDVRIYNYALGDQEIKDIYNNQ